MLERTSTCLESGGRKLLRTTKPCLRARRSLHSAFWHHGASDLSLPTWSAAPSAHESSNDSAESRAAKTSISTQSASPSGPLLEFLYPEKTLALLRQLSVPTIDATSPRRRRIHAPPVRHYATVPAHYEQPVVEEDAQALHKLREFLGHQKPGGQDEAWKLYSSIPAAHLAADGHWHLRADLLEYLAIDDDPPVPNRVLKLFEEIPEQHRRDSSYRAAIASYMSLRMVGPALQLLEDALSTQYELDYSVIGIDLVLRRTVLDEQWDLSLRVFSLYLEQKPTFTVSETPVTTWIRWGNTLPHIWKGVATLNRLDNHLRSFLLYLREFRYLFDPLEQEEHLPSPERPKEDKEKKRALLLFTMTFVPHTMDQVMQSSTWSEHGVAQFIRRLHKALVKLNFPMSVINEHTISRLLNVPSNRAVDQIPSLIAKVWGEHRQLCLDSRESSEEHKHKSSKPKLHTLRNLIIYYWRRDQFAQAHAVISDHHMFYPKEPMRAGLLKYMVHRFAEHGDFAQTEKYLEEFRRYYKDQTDVKLVSALAFACARRADVEGAIAQFHRIRDEFGLIPDTVCWNILILAYFRADDLDGALECFNTMVGNGIAADVYTFGTLLDACAQRGDVEAFEALYSRAEQTGVQLVQNLRVRSAYVEVFLQSGDVQAAEAVAQGLLKAWSAGTLSGNLTYTWNLLIQHCALERDIAGARARYREMIDHDIPLDSWTYGSLMRALVEVKQTNAAYKILRTTMPRNNLRIHALHYAIVMTGFLREGGEQLDLAVQVYQEMKKEKIPQTMSSQEAIIRTLGMSQIKELQNTKKHANYKLKDVDEAVEEMLADALQGQAMYREPQHTRQMDTRNYGSGPQALYGLLISLYAQRGAYKTCMRLIKKAERLKPDVQNYTVPITLATGAMEVHFKAGEHAEVARMWELARTSARKLVNTFSEIAIQETPVPTSGDLLDASSIRESFEQSRIAPNRRNILYKATRVYMRSLFDSKNPNTEALQEAQRTMAELAAAGYTIDVFTWNELVTTLAQRGKISTAFAICEEYLMPNFPGWRSLHPNYIRKDRKGYRWMELRWDDIRPDSIMPRYKTLIVLAAQYRNVRRDERNAIGYDEEKGLWLREKLEEAAPMTLRAIQSMPSTNDKLQMEYFHDAL
ncbi:hypothetical protein HBI52_065300 [Parastagonospora nodorum]|nr:hypothetical protein HBH46_216710 [Parastagonospora nodorum]KAH4921147.1 hypothetical protein HBI79_185450 [Parastagonospora nodorum]KAH5031418.1 hypothetical protein HBI74_091080 [Parastagonospora nodorum]KAH5108243.1 hypothetical protein HBH71_186610 [Parastagonospora nodorum]KAH5397450.1 hypothetical protein HBI32_193320 [Parastagonospora nodorum]